jgi:hypothetical protein
VHVYPGHRNRGIGGARHGFAVKSVILDLDNLPRA